MKNEEDPYWTESGFINDLINQIPAAIFWKNTQSIFLGCNQCFANLAGLSSPKEIIGKSDYELPWGNHEGDAYIKDDKNVMLSMQPKLGIEESQTLANGNVITLLTNKIPIFSKKNTVIGILGIFHDITDRKKIEEELRTSKNAAEAANHAKTEFIANMSHDIRTPLTGVVGMSHILEENLSDPTQKQYAHWLGESGDQLLGMLNGILDVISADNANDNDLHQEPFDLKHMLHDIIGLERPTTQVKGLDLLIHIDERIPRVFISDHTKIHRILLNLLGNAIKFTKKGQVEIGVDLVGLNKNSADLKFRVTDTGIGIPFELQDKVFDRFFRVTPSYKGIYTGHGVGLHIAQSYAHLLGGTIHVTSEPNVGTTFYFELTLKLGNETLLPNFNDSNHPTQETESTEEIDSYPFIKPNCSRLKETKEIKKTITNDINAPTLLLVEDNAIALKMLECLVANIGFNYVSAMDGEIALRLATEHVFDLIITDLGLPLLSGIEFTQEIRLIHRALECIRVPIVGLTAHADDATKQDCLTAGMDAVFSKPMTASCLSQIIDTYLSSDNKTIAYSQETKETLKEGALGFDLPNTEEALFELEIYPLLDVQSVLPGMNNDTNLLNNILKKMRDSELPKDLADIELAFKAGDWDWVEKTAHRMKGGLVYCGTSRLAHACQYLERYRKAGHTRYLEDLYHQLRRVADDTLETLNRWVLMME